MKITILTLHGTNYRHAGFTETIFQEDVFNGVREIKEQWHCVQTIDSPKNSPTFWVCEQKEGEFVQEFVPRK